VIHIQDIIIKSVRSGSVNKGKSTGKLQVSEEHNPQTPLTRLSHCTQGRCYFDLSTTI
jgi:hypothetical protein